MTPLRWFRYTGIAEGISFLVLLLIAMPLKYFMDWSLAVKYTGWAHGVLFVLYVAMAYYVKETRNWPLKRFVIAFLAAWLPLGTFVFDRELRKEEEYL